MAFTPEANEKLPDPESSRFGVVTTPETDCDTAPLEVMVNRSFAPFPVDIGAFIVIAPVVDVRDTLPVAEIPFAEPEEPTTIFPVVEESATVPVVDMPCKPPTVPTEKPEF
jgi:hypothetical protein